MIKVKVISQKGKCLNNHRVGDTFYITEKGIKGEICIHALYSILPKAFALLYNADIPWKTHACPDAQNPVVFSLEVMNDETNR